MITSLAHKCYIPNSIMLCKIVPLTFVNRFMHRVTNQITRPLQNSLCKKPLTSVLRKKNGHHSSSYQSAQLHPKGYATYTVNKPDLKSSDPQAKNNNPPSPHPEIHRERCDQFGCNGSICVGLCGNFVDRKAVAHATHGHPPIEPGKKKIKLANQDFNGQKKTQNAIMYKDAHNVNITVEDTQATQRMNQDSHAMTQLKQHEDKK